MRNLTTTKISKSSKIRTDTYCKSETCQKINSGIRKKEKKNTKKQKTNKQAIYRDMMATMVNMLDCDFEVCEFDPRYGY